MHPESYYRFYHIIITQEVNVILMCYNSGIECDPEAPSIQKGEELNGNARN